MTVKKNKILLQRCLFNAEKKLITHLCYSAKKYEKLYLFMGPADKKPK